jgi:hypothetical protein
MKVRPRELRKRRKIPSRRSEKRKERKKAIRKPKQKNPIKHIRQSGVDEKKP